MRSPYEQQELWKLAELFFQRDLGCFGRVLKVHGDLQPTASYLILAPRVQLFPDVLSAAKEFMTAWSEVHAVINSLPFRCSCRLDALLC